MKKLCLVFCMSIIISLLFPARAQALSLPDSGGPALEAPSAVLMEKQTGCVILEKDSHQRFSPASITKIMTMLIISEAIESGSIALEDTVTASSRAASFGGSCVYLESGERMSVSDMLKCIAVVSANDCAVAMAEHISGSEEKFVELMNSRAGELGLEDTHFTNCSGLFDSDEHYTSAYDVAVLSRELISHELIKDYTTIWMDSIRGGEFQLSNTNKLVHWYPGCTGLKTGYTSSAMFCLSATAEREGIEYIAVIMHSESSDSRNRDAEALLDYGFANYRLCPLRREEPLPLLPVELGRQSTVTLAYSGEEYALVSRSDGGAAEYTLSIPNAVKAPLKAGDAIGSMTVSLSGKVVAELPIIAAEDVPRLGFFGLFKLLGGTLFGL